MKNKLLIIDDDVLVLKTLKSFLTRMNYVVATAKNGNEAREKIASEDYDLIISDIRMPGENGLTGIEKMKEIFQQKKRVIPPFLFITGYASEDAPIRALALEAKDYLLKPFDNDQLIKAIEKNLARKPVPKAHASRLHNLCLEARDILNEFHAEKASNILEDNKLKDFLESLENKLDEIDKAIVKLD